MTVRKGRRRPGNVPPCKWVDRLQESLSSYLCVAGRRQRRPNQLALIRVEKNAITTRRNVNAGPILEVRHLVRFPDFLAGGRLQTNQFTGRLGRIHVVSSNQGRRSI